MEKLIKQLRHHEGCKAFAYKCTAGKLTIGVGRNIDEDGGMGLTDDEIDYLLANDIKRCQAELLAFSWFIDLDEVRRDAMVNLLFNLGMTRLLGFKNALEAMAKGDYEIAANEFLDSNYARQVGQRAFDITDMIRTGRYPEA